MHVFTQVPYCGGPPVPGHIIWNTDPVLAVSLVAVAALYAAGIRGRSIPIWRQVCFWSGWVVTALALMSPLCNLSVALFSARVAQHVILTMVAAPLLVLGQAECALAPFRARPSSVEDTILPGWISRGQWVAVSVFAIVMWLWHLPDVYDMTFRSTFLYWTMHVSMIGTALLLWTCALRACTSIASSLFAIFATMLQMSLLGAIFTFAGAPLFAVHAVTTWPWGLSPLYDQQLGGLVMWVVGGFLLAGYAGLVLVPYLVEEGWGHQRDYS